MKRQSGGVTVWAIRVSGQTRKEKKKGTTERSQGNEVKKGKRWQASNWQEKR